ncbi:response regulator [Pseudomonas sp. CrR14]|nr:response regulator [Pseudomonas sp. CrR14]
MTFEQSNSNRTTSTPPSMLEFPWHETPLGARDTWPTTLAVAVEMIMASKFPQCLVWGDELITIHNEAFKPLLGEKPNAQGRPFSDVWSESWEAIAPIAARAFAGEATFIEDFQLQVVRRGYPELAYFTFCYSPVRDEHGRVLGILDTVVETTEKVVIESQLLHEQQRQRTLNETLEKRVAQRTRERDSIWQHSRDLLATLDDSGRLSSASPSWQRILDQQGESLLGRSFLELMHPNDIEAAREQLALLTNDSVQIESRCAHADGSWRWIAWYLTVDGETTYAYGRDIDEEKQRAAALAQVEEQLRQAQKMDAVGQLTGGIAHDFNNLLAGIIGNLELLGSRISQGNIGGLERYTGAALGAANRAANLTHRLLAFSRRQTLAPKPINVNHLVQDLEELLQRTVGPHIQVEFDPAASPWTVLVDPNQLENAVLNLCINARDAMPEAGTLGITTRNVTLTLEQAQMHDVPPGEYLSLQVSDTGSGMAQPIIARAFDPFFTTKPTGKGTGLGLSMIYGFARQSGGMAYIESCVDDGTTVYILLPRDHQLAQAPDAAPQPGESLKTLPAPHKNILLVDDETTLRELIGEVLEELGYAVLHAENGPRALDILQSSAAIDLLLSDVGLPGGMNGRQVADAAREIRPGLKVLFITGYAESSVMHADDLDVDMQVLTKPFEIDTLACRVTQLLG